MNSVGNLKGLLLVGILALFLVFAPLAALAADEAEDTSETTSTQSADTQPAPDDSTPAEETEQAAPEKEGEAESQMSTLTETGGGTGGTGEKQFLIPDEFIPDNNFGGARFKIPLDTYPGRAGLTPDLTITYNSQRGNGWLGIGWNWDMGYIQRNRRFGVSYTADDFVVIKDGTIVSELKSRTTDWGTEYFGAKIENEFTKYYFNRTGNYWVATSRDGIKYYYGLSSQSRQDNTQGGIYKWCLEKVEDTNGNRIEVFYWRSTSGQLYLDHIEYNHQGPTPGVVITFYREKRDDASDNPLDYVTYGDGKSFKQITYRLKSIDIKANGQRVRAYAFAYTQKTESKKSRLATITQYDSDATVNTDTGEVSGNHLPPINLSNQSGSAGFQYSSWSTSNLTGIRAVDFNGDGIADILSSWEPTGVRVHHSNGSGLVNTWYPMTLTIDNIAMGDFNGDGRTDVITGPSAQTTYTVYFSTGYAPQNIGSSGPSFVLWSLGSSQTTDFDGDGKTDIAGHDSSGQIVVAFSNGNQSPWFQNVVVGEGGYFLVGDFNGDGRADIVARTESGSTVFYYANSTGRGFSTGVSYSGVEISYNATTGQYDNWIGDFNGDGLADLAVGIVFEFYPDPFNPIPSYIYFFYIHYSTGSGFYTKDCTDLGVWPTFLGDFNGDGLTDFATWYSTSSQVTVSYSTGLGFKRITHTTGLSLGSDPSMVAAGDFDGDGKTDLGRRYSSTQFRMNKSLTPLDLMITVNNDNNMGRVINIAYQPYKKYDDPNVPFIVQTVSSVSANPGSGQGVITASFAYEGGKYDILNRFYYGFTTVTKTFANSTTETSLFHQEEFTFGRRYQSELREPGSPGPLLVKTLWDWDTWQPSSEGVRFVYLNRKDIEYYDVGNLTASGFETYAYNNTNGLLETLTVSGTNLAETISKNYTYINKGFWIWRVEAESVVGTMTGLVRDAFNTYDTYGNLLTNTRSCHDAQSYNLVTTYGYDSYGNVTSVQVGSNPQTSLTYEALFHTFPETITNGLLQQIYRTYNYRYGKVATERDPNNNTTAFGYDTYGRLTSVDLPDNGEKIIAYNDTSLPRQIVTSHKEFEGYHVYNYDYFDGFGRKIQTAKKGEPYFIATQWNYDSMGRNVNIYGPYLANDWSYNASANGPRPLLMRSFDYRNRLTSEYRMSGVQTFYGYSSLDTTITDPDNKEKTQTKDWLGRLITVKEKKGGNQYTTQYAYNAAGDLTSVTDTNTNTTTMTYNALGQKIAMNDMDMGSWTYAYDNNGNLTNQYAPNGKNTTFRYDGINRVYRKEFSDSTPTAFFVYDTCPNGVGRLCEVTNESATTSFTYDVMGRVLTETRNIFGGGGPYTTTYEYYDDGKLKGIDYPGAGPTINYTYYPGTDLLERIYNWDLGIFPYVWYQSYEPTGLPGRIEYHPYQYPGTTTTNTYNRLLSRLTRLTTNSGGQTIQDYQYGYTPRGNVSSVIDNRNGVTYNYTYDDLHRLTSESVSGGGTTLSMDYDPLGNIVSKATAGNALAYSYTTAGRPHRLTGITQNGSPAFNFAYDSNGNMTTSFDLANPSSVMQRSIVYNAENMPTQIDIFPYGGGTTTTYGFAYDGNGKRVMKRIGMLVDTVYVGPHFEVANGVETSYIFAGTQRIAKVTSTATRYFHQDHLGSATRVTDASGALVEQAEYLPFGQMRSGSSSPPFASNYKYTDQEMDVGIGLYNYDARLYDPIIGRFISPDPIVPDPTNPQALNRYSYVLNNPLRYVDPTGNTESVTGGVEVSFYVEVDIFDDYGPPPGPGFGDGGEEYMLDTKSGSKPVKVTAKSYPPGALEDIQEGRFYYLNGDTFGAAIKFGDCTAKMAIPSFNVGRAAIESIYTEMIDMMTNEGKIDFDPGIIPELITIFNTLIPASGSLSPCHQIYNEFPSRPK